MQCLIISCASLKNCESFDWLKDVVIKEWEIIVNDNFVIGCFSFNWEVTVFNLWVTVFYN
jgi:hypothetical protein